MRRTATPVLIGLLALTSAPLSAQEGCRLCYGNGATQIGERPLTIEIFADLSFSRLALTGETGGSAEIDPQTGGKRTSGAMIDLGGMSVQGRGRITGEPGRIVRVDLPDFPRLDGTGALEFTFGARLVVRGRQGGNYRGRIPITVDYN